MAHAGYDKERFIYSPPDEFDCIICSEVVMDPLECGSCGKLFCKICITDWISKNPVTKCPNRCSAQIGPIASKALIKTYQNLQIRCSNPKCQTAVKLGEVKKHQEACLKTKCWNYENCSNPENESMKYTKPICSQICMTVHQINTNLGNQKKLYQILTAFLPNSGGSSLSAISSSQNISSIIPETLSWDPSMQGTGLVLSQNNTHVFLKEQAYVFRTIVANIGFSSGVHYWEIIADSRTQNEIKIGITSSKNFDLNSAFCDHPTGWAYYGLGQLRHGSNATGAAYGKRFKKDGILGVFLNMNNGTLSFALNGENMGVAYQDEKLKSGTFYPAVSLLHCAGCKIRGGVPIPSYFN